ncbi:MAG: 2-oxo acid dehydrogenase subunit E2, partial [Aeromicrobium sp.]
MAETSQDSSTPDFGTNQWLVDEMYDRYQQDPTSVDDSWVTFFENGNVPSDNGRPAPEPTHQKAQKTAQPEPAAKATSEKKAEPQSEEKPEPKAEPAQKKEEPEAQQTAEPKAEPEAKKESAPAAKSEPVKPDSDQAKKDADSEPPQPEKKAGDPGTVEKVAMKGAAARTVQNMDTSLTVPTATSVRAVPVKLLFDNRTVINNHLRRARGGKVSFTHIIGYAVVKALTAMPEMNTGFEVVDGKPNQLKPEHINFGLAIDLQKPNGTRQLVVPSIKAAEKMGFAEFWQAYETMVRKARDNKLEVVDFMGTTASLTNPGGIGTNHSVPRLMSGQGVIVGVGSMDYPPEFQGASEYTIAQMAVSKMMTLTSTYDHRVIQGAQ